MTGPLRTVEAGAHLAAAAYLMKQAGATGLVVVDGNEPKRPVGLITEADVARAVADGKNVNEVRIHDLLLAAIPISLVAAGTDGGWPRCRRPTALRA